MTPVDAYYDDPARRWPECQRALRQIVLEAGLEEGLKWNAPCYMAHGGNIAMVSALRDGAVLSFFKGVLLRDPEGLLQAPGKNSRSARWVKLTEVAEVTRLAPALRALVEEAVANEAAGRRVEMPKDDLDLPDELVEALDADADLAEAWAALTPGRRRGYVLTFAGAKQSETRVRRIEKHRAQILAGKGLHDR